MKTVLLLSYFLIFSPLVIMGFIAHLFLTAFYFGVHLGTKFKI